MHLSTIQYLTKRRIRAEIRGECAINDKLSFIIFDEEANARVFQLI